MYVVCVGSQSITADEVISAAPVLIPPSNAVIGTLGTCAYIFINADTVEYSLCPSSLVSLSKSQRLMGSIIHPKATWGIDTTTQCFTTTTSTIAGLCESSGIPNPGNNWLVL
jgi:hypothetical protein